MRQVITALVAAIIFCGTPSMAVERTHRAPDPPKKLQGDASEQSLTGNPIKRAVDDAWRRGLNPDEAAGDVDRAWRSATPEQQQQWADHLDRLIGGQNPQLPKRSERPSAGDIKDFPF
jgi:hypothetical protein